MRRSLTSLIERAHDIRGYSIAEILVTLALLGFIGTILLNTVHTGFDGAENASDKIDRSFAKAFILQQLSCSRTLSSGPCTTNQYVDARNSDGTVFISTSGTGYPIGSPSATLRVRCTGYELTPEYSDSKQTNAPLFGSNIPITCYPVRIFGIDNANDIYEINPISKTIDKVLANTGTPGVSSNSLAYDPFREQVFFTQMVGTSLRLKCWSRVSNTVTDAGSLADAEDPANASFFDNAYWFFTAGSNKLNRVNLSYNPAGNPSIASIIDHSIAGMNLPVTGQDQNTNRFGDIAINPNTTTLYGHTTRGRFFSVNLAGNPNNTFNELKPGTNPAINANSLGLQISFNSDETALYGHSYEDGKWYIINLNNGSLLDINFETKPSADATGALKGFRDLAGASWPKWSPNL